MIPRVKYKKPHRFNFVTVLVLLFVGSMAYTGFAFWPALLLRSRIKNELADALPRLYRANLRTLTLARAEEAKIRKDLLVRFKALGLEEKPTLTLTGTKDKVTIQAIFTVDVEFPWLERTFPLEFAPEVETSAARVKW